MGLQAFHVGLSHAVAVILVRIISPSKANVAKGAHVSIPRNTRISTGVRMRRSQLHIVGRMALQDVFINGARAETMHLSDGTRTIRALPLYPIKSWL